jgi:hypothetical protein
MAMVYSLLPLGLENKHKEIGFIFKFSSNKCLFNLFPIMLLSTVFVFSILSPVSYQEGHSGGANCTAEYWLLRWLVSCPQISKEPVNCSQDVIPGFKF